MPGKMIKIILLDAVLSIVVFFASAVIFAILGEEVFGSSTGADGEEYVNHSGIVLLAAFMAAGVFAVWFYKFLNKKSKVKE